MMHQRRFLFHHFGLFWEDSTRNSEESVSVLARGIRLSQNESRPSRLFVDAQFRFDREQFQGVEDHKAGCLCVGDLNVDVGINKAAEW